MPKQNVTIPFFIPNLGCPHKCVFCNQRYTTNTYKLPDAKSIETKVFEYLSKLKKTVNHVEIAFFGGSFTGINMNKQIEYLEIANKFYIKKLIQGIRYSTRPDFINDEIIDLAKKYNVTTIELGAQSFDDAVLKKSNRGHTAIDIITAANKIKKANINLIIQLMPGLPLDNFEKSIYSANETVKINPSGVRIYPTVVIKNTELEKMYQQKTFKPLTLEEAIKLTTKMYSIFTNNNINVIRMGLHPLSDTSVIIAGPYHPSFGFLVKSYYYKSLIIDNIKNIINENKVKSIEIIVPKNLIPVVYGYKKQNIYDIKKMFDKINFKTSSINNNIEYKIVK